MRAVSERSRRTRLPGKTARLLNRENMETTGAFFATKTFVLFMLIMFCGAQHLICNVTQDLHGTLYSVSELEATECSYSWMNSTGHVLANEKEKMDHLVSNSSIRTLLTHTCFVQLNYTLDCVSEGIQHTASCLTDCMTPEPLKIKGTPRQYWGTVISVSIMVLVLLGLIYSCFTRNQPPSTDHVEAQRI